jgi:hypothetical protein
MTERRYRTSFTGETGSEEELLDYMEAVERAADRLGLEEDETVIRRAEDLGPDAELDRGSGDQPTDASNYIHFDWDRSYPPLEDDDPVVAWSRFSGEDRRVDLFFQNFRKPEYSIEADGDAEVRDVLEEETGEYFLAEGDTWGNLRRSLNRAIEEGYALN